MREAMSKYNEAGERLADYTGGTKTMSAALVVAALLQGWDLSLVSGERMDTVKVVRGTELARRVRADPYFVDETLRQVQILYRRHEYAGAAGLLSDLMANAKLPGKEVKRLTNLSTFLRALSAWDRFVYDEAYALLRTVGELWPAGCECLSQLRQGKRLDLSVSDLVSNARRRAKQSYYEEAVLRLYRAVELLAQLQLRIRYGQDTAGLDLDRLNQSCFPQDLAAKLRERKEKEGRTWAGLVEAYEILAALDDPVGQVFHKHQKPIKDILSLRNKLFLTHGLKPITKEEWERSYELADAFLTQAFKALGCDFAPVEFPCWEEVQERIKSI